MKSRGNIVTFNKYISLGCFYYSFLANKITNDFEKSLLIQYETLITWVIWDYYVFYSQYFYASFLSNNIRRLY